MKLFYLIIGLLLFNFIVLKSNTIKVPEDIATIQTAMDNSNNGDTVLVSPGTYYENINFKGKNIVLGSLFLTTGDTSYISQTIIDGSQQGCVVVFESGEDSTTVLTGFTITNGYSYHDLTRGGGISIANSSCPFINNVVITKNKTEGCNGAGILSIENANAKIRNSNIYENEAEDGRGGGIATINSQIFLEYLSLKSNVARGGGGIYIDSAYVNIDSSIINKNIAKNSLGGGGIQITNNSSVIFRFTEIAYNETIWKSVAAIGPFGDGGGINTNNNSSVTIEECKIKNNNSAVDGGGIYIYESEVNLERTEVSENIASRNGGGVYFYCENQIDVFKYVTIKNNLSHGNGGGIYMSSCLLFTDTSNCNVFLNQAYREGTDIYIKSESENLIYQVYLDTTTVSQPENYHISPIDQIDFHFRTPIFNSVDSDLYVSPIGSNYNSGLSETIALKNLYFALLVIKTDSNYNRKIFLDSGIYSPSTNGEKFPLYGKSFVSLIGENTETTILDGENSSRLIRIVPNSAKINLMNFTVQNGYDISGGGMAIAGDEIMLKNLLLKENTAEVDGAGLSIDWAKNIKLINLTIINNKSNYHLGNGGIFVAGDHISLLNNIIIQNYPNNLKARQSIIQEFSLNIAYSNIGGGFEGIDYKDSTNINWLEGNIDSDPLFIGGDPFDYNLTDNSPSINAGTPFYIWEGDTLINLSSDEYIGEAPDMGALESDVLISVEGKEELPTEFRLEQNYPNPFNPTTKIQYQIPSNVKSQKSNVKLVVYDVLGREVTTLVNEQQQPGNYSVQFDGTNLTTGIYFYQLKTESFSQTKKFVLIK